MARRLLGPSAIRARILGGAALFRTPLLWRILAPVTLDGDLSGRARHQPRAPSLLGADTKLVSRADSLAAIEHDLDH
jgi:hypothetical protein